MNDVDRQSIGAVPRRKRPVVLRALAEPRPVNGHAPAIDALAVEAPKFPNRTFDISHFGAVPDGCTLNTAAFEAAIAACATAGGGRVLAPGGEWLTGPIHLRSNVELHLAPDAIVRFSSEPRHYLPAVFVRWSGQECYNYSPLIYARDCHNIAITGKGRLMGNGASWWSWEPHESRSSAKLYRMVLGDVPVADRRFGTDSEPLRPQFFLAINCQNVLLENFTIGEGGPFWTIHAAYCRNVTVRGLSINAPLGPNTNGIVIDSSSDVLIDNCTLHTNDDCIALKSGLNEDGWRVGRATENVVIRNVRCTGGHGAISIGSEMSGGVRNVLVHDCRFDDTQIGIRLKAARGRGGVVEDLLVRDVAMGRITGDAIQMTTEYSTFVSPDGRPPTFRNITIRNITCRQAETAVRMIGLPDSALQGISLENVTIAAREGLFCAAGNGIRLVDVRITPRIGPVLSVKDSQEVLISGLNNPAADSVFLDLRGRRTRNIRLRGKATNPGRPVVVLGVDVPRDSILHE